VRSRNCLKKMNIKLLGDLLRTTEQELLSYKNFGETSLNEIKALLASKGLRLGQAVEEAKGGNPLLRRATGAMGNVPVEVVAKSVADLELSVRSRKALQRLNINTLGELASRTEDELLGCKNFGQTSLNEIKQQLTSFGLNLRKLED
jgi:DNA-directed RNA polymerase subunit alpha